ncbi:hypothetical protein VTN77DRAFT_6789 [Rasamsonia byssochlamydoides]|uniref:uncharacterized protein n=1 Tax=Rasamsonia byssochlamydoides TaxID=89139 RepID=UPI0037438420
MAFTRDQDDGINETAPSPSPSSSTSLHHETPIPDQWRPFSRSPHPYHRKSSRLLEQPGELPSAENGNTSGQMPIWMMTPPRTSSDSGTEADDESTGFLRGLPAPPVRPRKGLRTTAGTTPPDDPALWLANNLPWSLFVRSPSRSSRGSSGEESYRNSSALRREVTVRKRRNEVLRRLVETALLVFTGVVVFLREDVRLLALSWHRELLAHVFLVLALYALYPVRISFWSSSKRRRRLRVPSSFAIPPSFDPAPLLYPIVIPVLASLSLSQHHPALVLPNIILSLSSLPPQVIPLYRSLHGFSLSQWAITVIPIIVSEHPPFESSSSPRPLSLKGLDPEVLLLMYPLQQALIPTLDFLLTTSLLPAELQLLGTALINLVIFSNSPQAEILKALLWLGGLSVFVLCRSVLRWEVALARVPSWKFRRSPSSSHSSRNILNILDHKICQKISGLASNSEDQGSDSDASSAAGRQRKASLGNSHARETALALDSIKIDGLWPSSWTGTKHFVSSHKRRHTISTFAEVEKARSHRPRTTPGGRRKRSVAPSLAPFFSMTAAQARIRKWLYALYIYAAVLLIILGPIRKYVAEKALHGSEPFGWALGYLFGNISFFRFWVLMFNLEHWIQLPPRRSLEEQNSACHLGWVEHLRHDTFGEANARLVICAYCVLVLVVGMAIVFRLSKVVEVDTRRKVFHGMMVLMFLPITYIDPAFSALALALVLSVFLLLDLFRASQLPPISKPLTYFLAPYTDGRDHRGPVIVSHIFLLIGCAIPLWLSLADLPRAGALPWPGWEVVSRDVSMVSGVICVGMGDAAASLIGRRFGRLKWFWGGGKSLEGSVAFAVAVSVGLIVARAWLTIGGWQRQEVSAWWLVAVVLKSVLAAGVASLTEAVLTGGNDNVIVPVVLWLVVRGLDI